jgi:hypothetical protein
MTSTAMGMIKTPRREAKTEERVVGEEVETETGIAGIGGRAGTEVVVGTKIRAETVKVVVV